MRFAQGLLRKMDIGAGGGSEKPRERARAKPETAPPP